MNIQTIIQGKWLGTYVAKASYGTFSDRVSLQISADNFTITYYDQASIRSSATGSFRVTEDAIIFNAAQEMFAGGSWQPSQSSLQFSFLYQKQQLTLEATDVLGVHKKIVVSRDNQVDNNQTGNNQAGAN